MTELEYATCEDCGMPRLSEELMGNNGEHPTCYTYDPTAPFGAQVPEYFVECGDYGKIRPCEQCGDIFPTDDLTACEFYGHGTAICRPCHENAGGSWRCYTER